MSSFATLHVTTFACDFLSSNFASLALIGRLIHCFLSKLANCARMLRSTFFLTRGVYTGASAHKFATRGNVVCIMSDFAAFFEASQTHEFVLDDFARSALVGCLVDD